MTTYFDKHGPLHVSGTQLVDANGIPVQLRGVSTLGLAWYPEFVNEAGFRTLRDDWGANAVRLAMYTQEKAGLEALIEKGVGICRDLGMYVIVDWHILSDGNPEIHADAAEDFFRRMSAKFAAEPHVLYEICNEPNGAGVTWPVVKGYAQRIIPVIRANAPKAVVLCGTPNWSQDVDLAAADPLDIENVMYSLHFYAATHKDGLRDKAEAAMAAGAPIFIDEFSICDASGDGILDYDSAAAWRALIQKHGLSYIAWSLSNRDESAALIRADSAKTSDWGDSDLTETGTWFRNVLREDK